MIYTYIIGGAVFITAFTWLAILMRKEYKLMQEIPDPCPEFPFFGARYNDATCIDGRLWDLDSCNDEGLLTNGGEHPCPFCDAESFKENLIEIGDYTDQEADSYIKKLHDKYLHDEK